MPNPITEENAEEGTLEWQLTRFHLDDPPAVRAYPLHRNLRSSAIEGYASETSIYPGESINFMVSTNPASEFHVDVYRLGHYGGTGGRHVLDLGTFSGKPQPVPKMSDGRLRECNWPVSATLTIPDDWVSGVYLAKLTRDEPHGAQSYVIFVVKEQRESDLLFQVSDLTWQAYNKWPGMDSLYDDGTPEMYSPREGNRVGFDRPYARYFQGVDTPLSLGSGEFLIWEYPMAFWLEEQGYDVTYCSNRDLHLDPAIIERCKAFLSVGHDEYWTREMFDTATAARDNGVSLLFFSGNALSCEIIPHPNAETGAPFRSFTRGRPFDDEQELMGSSSYGPAYGDWTVAAPDHWVFEGTDLKKGESIPGLIGFEYHGAPFKDSDELEVLAQSSILIPPARPPRVETQTEDFRSPQSRLPTASRPPGESVPSGEPSEEAGRSESSAEEKHAAVIYPGPAENWVVNVGTIWWSAGLSHPPGYTPAMARVVRNTHHGVYTYGGRSLGPDARVQQITRNILDQCID